MKSPLKALRLPPEPLENWKTFSKEIGRALSSLELTVVLLVLMMILVFFGTLDQVHMGTWLAQKKYFSSWLIYLETDAGNRYPIFPGGYTVGGLWLLNLLAAHTHRMVWTWKRAGILLIHSGLFVLLLGQGLTQWFAVESQMALPEGATRQYSEDHRDAELVLIDVTDPETDTVHAIPASLLAQETVLIPPGLPFTVDVKRFFPNAELRRGKGSLATRGVGPGIGIEEVPVATADDESNNVSALVELKAGGEDLGTWLVSTALNDQTFSYQGRDYRLLLRSRRYYHPFSLHLKDFRHDRYPGTEIPKNFSSLLQLTDPETGEDREVLIFMNHPLRYRGLTFYQASFGEGDTLSILQVVRNPVWGAPYLACVLVSLGLAVHFLMSLFQYRRRSA